MTDTRSDPEPEIEIEVGQRKRGIDDIARTPIKPDGPPRLDPAAIAVTVPEAVLDAGTATWPTVIDQVRLIPTLWLAVQQLAARVDELEHTTATTPKEPR